MSAAQARGKGGNLTVWVRLERGGVQRSIGSSSPRVLTAIQAMLADMYRREDAWDLLQAIADNRTLADGRKLTLRLLHEFYAGNALGKCRALLDAVDLRLHVDAWQRQRIASGTQPATIDTYRWQLERLMAAIMGAGQPWLASKLDAATIEDALAGLNVSSGTARKNLAALQSFVKFCRKRKLITTDVLADVDRPKKNKSRRRWEPVHVVKRLVESHDEPLWRAYFALIFGTGAEVSPALTMTRADLDLPNARAHIPGTKDARGAGARDRWVSIELWAVPILAASFGHILPHVRERLFPESWTRYAAKSRHDYRCAKLGIEDLTLHDSRHCVAVWMRLRGRSLEDVAAQLGHDGVTGQTLIYARYTPSDERTTDALLEVAPSAGLNRSLNMEPTRSASARASAVRKHG